MTQGQTHRASMQLKIERKFFANPRVALISEFVRWLSIFSILFFCLLNIYLQIKNDQTRDYQEKLALSLASLEGLETSLINDTEFIIQSISKLPEGPVQQSSDSLYNSMQLDRIPSLLSAHLISLTELDNQVRVSTIWPKSNIDNTASWSILEVESQFVQKIKQNNSIELFSNLPKKISDHKQNGLLKVLAPLKEKSSIYIILVFDKQHEIVKSAGIAEHESFQLSLNNKDLQFSTPLMEFSNSPTDQYNFEINESINFLSEEFQLKIRYHSDIVNKPRLILICGGLVCILLIYLVSDLIYKRYHASKINKLDKEVAKQKKYIAIRERQLKLLTDFSPVGIMLCDKDGNQLIQNTAFNSIFNISSKEGNANSWINSVEPSERENVKLEWNSIIQDRKHTQVNFHSTFNKDEMITMLVHPIDFESIQVGFLVFVTKNSSSQEKNLDNANPQLTSHETEPESGIEIGSDNSLDVVIQEGDYLNYAQHSEQHSNQLEQDSPDLAEQYNYENSIDNPKEVQTSEASIINILKEVIDLLHHKAKRKGVKLGVQISANAPSTIQLSPWLLKLSLIELIDSALDRADSGSIRIVYGAKGEPARPYFSIKDDSAKSSLMELHNISELKSDKALPALTRDGTASFSFSELSPKGNRVSLILNQNPSDAISKSTQLSGNEQSRKALILEKDLSIRDKLRELLRLSNIECCFANSDKEASLFINKQAVDFVFINSDMSHESLAHIITICRKTKKELPIISITDDQSKFNQISDGIKFISSELNKIDLEKALKNKT